MAKRSYFEELAEIESTWATITTSFNSIPSDFNSSHLSGTACCIGSGGSLALAKLWQFVHESYGLGMAKTVTPYEYLQTQISSDTVVLFSASGKNHDILQAFRVAMDRGCKIVVFTSTKQSPLLRLTKMNADRAFAIYPSTKIPKDGFLAVNSVIAIGGLMVQMENHLFCKEFNEISIVKLACEHHLEDSCQNIFMPKDYTTQIIASEWGTAAALDLESRLAESGVSSCFMSDPRNFGHGRFLWLNTRKENTFTIIIHTAESKAFIKRFRRLLPSDIPCYTISAPYAGLVGGIYCITRSMLLFGDLAKKKGIDPGKPNVPQWGRKIHNLRVESKRNLLKKAQKDAQKKSLYPALCEDFAGVVMDIDGTLVNTVDRYDPIRKDIAEELKRLLSNGLKIGFATGRGKSAIRMLREQVPECFHESIIVGVYNGTVLIPLSGEPNPKTDLWPIQKLIIPVVTDICNDVKEIKIRPTQISLRGIEKVNREAIMKEISLRLGKKSRFVKMRLSGHSLDISPVWASKLTVVQAVAEDLQANVLCIGDQGQIDGNDEDLLGWEPSVSVGKIRPASNRCLWVGKHDHLQESSGTLFILKAIKKDGAQFKIVL